MIQVFGPLTDIVGAPACRIDPVADTDALRDQLFQKYPLLKQVKFTIAVDNRIARENTEIGSSSDIALLPPFSGG